MRTKREFIVFLLAIAVGAALWLVSAQVSGRREPWDSAFYWKAAYPVALVLSGILGYVAPERPWRWPLAVMLAQFAAMAIKDGFGSMWPLGLVLFGILSLPGMAIAGAAGRIRLRRARP
jgi:hypothetical protein